MMKTEASAPSNIALIKYMGKIEEAGNRPTNSSLSWTLEDLRSFVVITHRPDLTEDTWAPLKRPEMAPMDLSAKSVGRFLIHFQNLKTEFGVHDFFQIESGNNFPSDCGLASSASSFAALTMAAVDLFAKMGNSKAQNATLADQAELSRRGSGSSCRSFFGPWALWYQDGVRPVEFPSRPLHHQVIIVEDAVKAVSSSEAHRRVSTSPKFLDRPQRAERRLAQLMDVFREGCEKTEVWKQAFGIVWDEFQDMHELFETSVPAFSYRTAKTHDALDYLADIWEREGDGPLVTMDAGANVHLLYREDQKPLAARIREHFAKDLQVFTSSQSGAAQ
jgi:diphosphomevalonate decarboxylase